MLRRRCLLDVMTMNGSSAQWPDRTARKRTVAKPQFRLQHACSGVAAACMCAALTTVLWSPGASAQTIGGPGIGQQPVTPTQEPPPEPAADSEKITEPGRGQREAERLETEQKRQDVERARLEQEQERTANQKKERLDYERSRSEQEQERTERERARRDAEAEAIGSQQQQRQERERERLDREAQRYQREVERAKRERH